MHFSLFDTLFGITFLLLTTEEQTLDAKLQFLEQHQLIFITPKLKHTKYLDLLFLFYLIFLKHNSQIFLLALHLHNIVC